MNLSLNNTDVPSARLLGHMYVDDAPIAFAEAILPLADSFEQFRRLLARSRGQFALVVIKNGELWAAVDRLRSMPLFYSVTRDDCLISDDPYWLRDRTGDGEMDRQAAAELWHLLYVLRDGTLAKGVRQLRAGELMRVRRKPAGIQLDTHLYYRYRSSNNRLARSDGLMEELDRLHLAAFTEMIESAQGRPIAVPLSGGLDSRLAVCMLRRLGVCNVTCFSYGRPDNAEARVSCEVAEFLGHPWRFVSYRRDDWDAPEIHQARRRFMSFASRLCALPPLLEDWLAVGLMTQRGDLPPETIFCPGHTAAFSSGRQVLTAAARTSGPATLAEVILRANSPRLHWRRPPRYVLLGLRAQIERTLHELAAPCSERPWNGAAALEAWNWQERQSKRIVNMVRAYEFWGHDWRVPLWDARLMDFWDRVPTELRLGKSLYRRYLSTFSESRFFGLFNDLRSAESTNPLPQRPWSELLRKPLQRNSIGRYLLADKRMEQLVGGGGREFLHALGTRVLSPEPVTSPWLLLEREGLEGMWQAH